MTRVYFTADLHLGHKAIVEHCHRPFASIEEHDERLIDNINSIVAKGDRLYILGDFSLGNRETVQAQRIAIKCGNVYLIRGNHDRLSDGQYRELGFIYKGDMEDIKVDNQHITLCHYAMRRWNKSHHGAWCLFGHSHGQLADDPSLFSFDVGVDCWKYTPISFEFIKEQMALRTQAVAHPNHLKEAYHAE